MPKFVVVQGVEAPVFAPGHAPIAEVGAISNDALVFHTQVWGLSHAVFINAERVGAQHFFIKLDVLKNLGKEFFTLFVIIGQHIKHHREGFPSYTFVRPFNAAVRRKVERYVVNVDGGRDVPVESLGAVFVFAGAAQTAIAGCHQGFGDPHIEGHGIRLIGYMVFAGPPEVGSFALASGGDPGCASFGSRPGEATIPGGTGGHTGLAAVEDAYLYLFTRLAGKAEVDPYLANFAYKRSSDRLFWIG